MFFVRIVAIKVAIQNHDKKSYPWKPEDKLIQYSNFIQDERLRLHLTNSYKNGINLSKLSFMEIHSILSIITN